MPIPTTGLSTTSHLETAFGPEEFFGVWAVQRTILDRMNVVKVEFAGTAVISRYHFEEDGETFSGGMLLASRRKYALSFTYHGVDVAFHDLRAFGFISRMPSQKLDHRCGDDDYSGRLLFPNPESLIEVWRVRGPRKNYTSFSRYQRIKG
ncbi:MULTISPECIES: DUF6314 family protein [Rhizobium/Agrobacterium group]|uniref:DUF6314 family protein n=1 Tax=Rhizobium/Agrobacterium group TaxID=227290 RepID=UPI0023002863|nr:MULTISPECIES: DUF6314 family protein [Rhizobium/Agrobacterium group]MDA5635934.1 DUF6314 family protein [Agrobacterium sp. ST15.16.024]MDF1891157.1 DUF6314 family protein [Rhizobium rhizogenes]